MPSTQIPSQKTTVDSSKTIPNRRVHSLTKASGKAANISASLDLSKTASAKKESLQLNSIENSEKRKVEENSDVISDGSISSTDIALN